MIAAILRTLFGSPPHDYDEPYDGAEPATLGAIADQLAILTELVRDIRNLLADQHPWETESDLLNMAAADKRIAERLKHRK